MSLMLGNPHSDVPIKNQVETKGKKKIGRGCANYHPSVWGDRFVTLSPDEMASTTCEIDEVTKRRAVKLKEQLKKMLLNVSDSLQELNLINEIQRLGVAYHFEKEIKDALSRMHDAHINGNDISDDLHAVALWFRLLRQQGYNVSSNVFRRFKDENGEFKATLKDDIRGLLSLYEAAYLGTREDNILDEAINFTTEHLKSAMSHLSSPLSTLVQFALDLPLHKCVERLQSRYYISIYQEEERNDILLEFAKFDFNMLQSLHKKELSDISRWWKENDFSTKLPFIRDRIVELYFWILEVYFEPQYARARRMMTTIISLTSILDDIYDVHGTLEELELYTVAIERWDRAIMDQLPDYMKVHYNALLNAVEKFEDELSKEGKSYRIPYLKKALTLLAKGYLEEARWTSEEYVPTLEEYMKIALITNGYPMLSVASLVGMGDIVTKEAFEWAINVPKVVEASAVICRLRDDITSNEFEQERTHVVSGIHCYMKEHGTTYREACKVFLEKTADAWKDANMEWMEPTPVPREVIKRPMNLARVIELLYQHQDSYTNSAFETKEHVTMMLVDPIPV
ncbi:sesquiterpene synthase TPS2-like isoform X2 [Magnolia sinica]|uniref:sesquiterpene synthase TPS2-like isoform X2 n=1 Tax=Magnolia sinica TaxID=86752 RepID=UPI00265A51F2|nr:sesquiterpene synthase TPS2-like isoform X2 [Magnolia sinica]